MSRCWWDVHGAALLVERGSTVQRAGWGAQVSRAEPGYDWVHFALPSPVSGKVAKPDGGSDVHPDWEHWQDPSCAYNLVGVRLVAKLPGSGVSVAEINVHLGEERVVSFPKLALTGPVRAELPLPPRRISCGLVMCVQVVWTAAGTITFYEAGGLVERVEGV